MPAPAISEAETHVMEVLWHQHPLSTDEVALALQGQQDWQLPTIKTLLSRLLAKGAISAVKDGRRFLYSPVLKQKDWLKAQSLRLVDRWFGGRLAPLVAQFASHRKLKRADIEAIKKLLQEHERG
jgi:BlaI family transcriptional regulator, penicillinase repressor